MRDCYREGIHRRVLAALTALLLCLMCLPLQAFAQETQAQTLRVAFPIQKGFTEVDEQGRYSGYTYEYLQEIAQYTGWEYEFVQVPGDMNEALTKMMEMLENGEIDLMGGLVRNDALEEIYDYPTFSYGTAYSTLSVLQDNTSLNETNYQTQNGLRVAVLRTAKQRIAGLQNFCDVNNIPLQLVECDNQAELVAAMQQDRADAALGNDVDTIEGTRFIAKFSAKPYYFATTKGNTEIINKLNFSILKINESDPYFSTVLHNKYFGEKLTELHLTDAEREYIRQAGVLKVGVAPFREPIQSYNAETGTYSGIAIDFLNHVAMKTGLQISYVHTDTLEELQEMARTGKIDIVASLPYGYDLAKEYSVGMTRPYVSSQIIMVINDKMDPSNLQGSRLALTRGLEMPGVDDRNAVWYDSLEDCLKAVSRGEADYTYGNSLLVENYTDKPYFRNVTMVPQSSMTQRICVGIVKPVNETLLTIFNKAVTSIPEEEMQSFVYRNTVYARGITLSTLIDSNPRLFAVTVVGLAAIVVGAVLLYAYNRVRISRKIALENRRYQQLCDLSNEYLFEYQYARDRMIFSEKYTKVFGGPQTIDHFYDNLLKADDPDLIHMKKAIREMRRNNGGSVEFCVMMPDNSQRWVRAQATIIKDESGKSVYAVGKVVDIQREKEERDQLVKRAQRDSLTGVYNTATSRSMIVQGLQESGEADTNALIIIDIDHFKDVNDRFGHYIGDQTLIALARALQDNFRREDIVGRLGGDEFVIFMRRIESTRDVADKCACLLHTVHKMTLEAEGPPVTLSIGVAVAKGCEVFETLYKKADQALYTVKERGRNGFEIV